MSKQRNRRRAMKCPARIILQTRSGRAFVRRTPCGKRKALVLGWLRLRVRLAAGEGLERAHPQVARGLCALQYSAADPRTRVRGSAWAETLRLRTTVDVQRFMSAPKPRGVAMPCVGQCGERRYTTR
ncbi:hypothetical protein HYPSUDRAFT_568157 [Hypholoma sublateritium FD-334 SS-4]|uniref:Uncharacterized protein n=1 Tax=Hypholoma sublateritium (strain FD-334 SS-4) TaxID=945553 RepID=A0A0D2N263_HYPSF|nr:hypothetical protein HYPSUDRAFT_568157 [Hypholoma sublateritium FD-334 SS-4]